MKLKNLAYIIPFALIPIATGMQDKPSNQIKEFKPSSSIEEKTKEMPQKKEEFLENAKSHIGTPYREGGRKTERLPGIDCMGLVFKSYSETFNENWKNYSVNPKELIENETLGEPVKGLDGTLSKNIDKSKFEEGDIIYFLRKSYYESPNTIMETDSGNYKVGHMGIYSDKEDNMVLNAFAPGTKVKEHSLEMLTNGLFSGVYVSRPNWKKD